MTDSTTDIPADLLINRQITVVPVTVEIEGEIFRDGIDLSRAEFLRRLQAGQFPRTSQPSIGTFQETYRGLIDQGYDILSIHIAAKLSGTWNSAQAAAQAVAPERIRVVDSETVSMALGWLAIEAHDLAAQGRGLDDLAAYLETRRADGRVIAMVETLEYLRRGGRIGRASAFLGSALQIKPIIEVSDGAVEPRERVRTSRRAVDRIVAIAQEMSPFDHLTVMHLGAEKAAQAVAERISEFHQSEPIVCGELGVAIGTYSGPGLVGFAGLVRSRSGTT